MRAIRRVFLVLLASGLSLGSALAEVLYLVNGDIVHGELVSANNTSVTLKTPYGTLEIPKSDIKSIGAPDAGAAAGAPAAGGAAEPAGAPADLPSHAASLSFNISGRSFWYAFDSPDDAPADTSIRLRLSVGTEDACAFVDERPDTVDGATLYNSFTFSSADARLDETAEGYECEVQQSDDGNVWLAVSLAASEPGARTIRMSYQIHDDAAGAPRWTEVLSRAFTVDVVPGKHTVVSLRQDASGLEYTGLFNKSMKNLESFEVSVLSSELR